MSEMPVIYIAKHHNPTTTFTTTMLQEYAYTNSQYQNSLTNLHCLITSTISYNSLQYVQHKFYVTTISEKSTFELHPGLFMIAVSLCTLRSSVKITTQFQLHLLYIHPSWWTPKVHINLDHFSHADTCLLNIHCPNPGHNLYIYIFFT